MNSAPSLLARLCIRAVACLILLAALPTLAADIVVIANTRVSLDSLSREDAIKVFMGRYRKLPDGSPAQPLDLDPDSEARKNFYRLLINKSLEEVNAYWARLIFSGHTLPPQQAQGAEDVLTRIASDPQIIGYMDRGDFRRLERSSVKGRSIKVILELTD